MSEINASNHNQTQVVTLDDYIVDYFLNLFKKQLGASDLDFSEAVLADPSGHVNGKDKTYILNVKYKGNLRSRRMTIGRLGDNIANKSICYKVIYDDILVLKVPPKPVNDFDEYIENINAERRVAKQLSEHVNCVTPSITVILKKNPFFQNKEKLSPSKLENKYIDLLKSKVGLQGNLKIGQTFIIFMSLSKYAFFNQVISKLHDAKADVKKEINRNINALYDLDIFDGLYGAEHNAIFKKINTVCILYENKITDMLNKHGLTAKAPPFKIREWLIAYLNSEKADFETDDLSPDFIKDLNTFNNNLFKKYETDILDYRKMINEYVVQKNFAQHHTKFKGIIENTLDILGWLKERQVAMRDLKPDNMFVVGEPEMPDAFLADPQKYSLGLIDFETSVCYKPSARGRLFQPLLAGTPSYATPSHLFPNEILQSVFGDVPRILFLQDWYAVIGIIYNIVTGDILFADTGKLLHEIMMLRHRDGSDNSALVAILKKSSWVFWHSAVDEYNKKMRINSKYFKKISIEMPARRNPMRSLNIDQERDLLIKTVETHIDSQNFFKKPKSRQDLKEATPAKVRRLIRNWEKGVNTPQTRPKVKTEIIQFLQNLERLKSILQLYSQSISTLSQKKSKMRVDQLLETVFNVILNVSYHEDWSDRNHPRIGLRRQ